MSDNELRIGHVLRQAAAASWANIGRWIALVALVQAPILFYWVSGLDQHVPEGLVAESISTVVHVAFYVVAEAAVTAAMLAHLRGQRLDLSALLGMALRLPAPLIQFVIAYGLISALFMLFTSGFYTWFGMYPGIGLSLGFDFVSHLALYLLLVLAVPVLVNERTGALEAVKRSVFLAENHRGRIAGLYALLYLIRSVISIPLLLWANWTESPESYADRNLVWSLASRLIGPVLWGAVNTCIYRTLRLVKEGVDIESTPSVPDARIHTPG